jgi:hypothetical protein
VRRVSLLVDGGGSMWLLFGAFLGCVAAYLIPYAIDAVGYLFRRLFVLPEAEKPTEAGFNKSVRQRYL